MSVVYRVEDFVDTLIQELDAEWKTATAVEMGLDSRSFYGQVWYSREGIVTMGNTHSLEYYGGFEYIFKSDPESVTRVRNLTIWSNESRRVRECLYRVLPKEEAHDLAYEYAEHDEYFGEDA